MVTIVTTILLAVLRLPTVESTPPPFVVRLVQLPASEDSGPRRRAYEFGTPIAEREGWKAEQFFQDPETLAICDALSMHDDLLLKRFVETPGNNLSATGKHGLSLLHWAYAEHNLVGFRMLLEAGVSPDVRLSSEAPTQRSPRFFKKDWLLFTVLRHKRYDFFMAALKYSKKPNQKDARDDLLIHEFFAPDQPNTFERFGYTSELMVQAVISSKTNLDLPNHLGSYPVHLTAQNRRPRHCLMLLQAGASPHSKNGRGKTISDILVTNLDSLKNWKGPGKPQDGLIELLTWLKSHDIELPDTLEDALREMQSH